MAEKYEVTVPDAKASKTLEGKLTIVAAMLFGACIITSGGFALAGKTTPAYVMGVLGVVAGLSSGFSLSKLIGSRTEIKNTKIQADTAKELAAEKKSTTD